MTRRDDETREIPRARLVLVDNDAEVFDAETADATPDPEGPPVDRSDERRPVFAAIVGKADERRPIVPAMLRRDNLIPTVKHVSGNLAHRAGYHLYRFPLYYLPLATFWAFIGVFRMLGKQLYWWWVLEQHALRQEAATHNDPLTWLKLHREAKATRLWRGIVLGAELVAVVTAAWLVWAVAPWWVQVAVGCLLLPTLAHFGRPADKPIMSPAVIVPRYRKLTAELVRAALVSLRIAGIKEPEDITFPVDIHRDGPGQLAIVDLPQGVDAVEVIEKRAKLASGLRVPLDQVWPEPMPKAHPGRLAIWVGYQPASQMKQPPWPLLKAGAKADIFKPFPFGTDPRLRTVTGALMYRNWLIGAMPGAGKTFSLRLPLLVAALDPRVDLRGYELKGTGDLDMLEPVCSQFGSGADDDTAEAALEMLRGLFDECVRRGPIIKRMAKAGKSPENKVTPELAAMPGLGLRPIVAFIDECQMLFAHSRFGAEAAELAEKIIRLGRALGIILLLATQRPDKDSLPKGISANAGVRFCLRVTGQVENDMVLGTSMYKQGIRATMFTDEDLGWGWLAGLGKKPQTVHGYEVDGPAAARVVARAIELRRAAGVPVDDEQPRERVKAYNLLEDVRAVWPQGEEALWSELIVPRLQRLRPEVYGDWDVSTFGAAMKAAGVPTSSIHRKVDGDGQRHPRDKGFTRWGVKLTQLEAALEHKAVGAG